MDELITVFNLTKRFGNFLAVNNISFQIRQGEIMAFLGPNGAGKTTTIKMLNGLLKPTSGSISIKGFAASSQHAEIKKICGYMSQKFSLYPLLTANENIEFFAGISGIPRQKIISFQKKLPKKLIR